MVDTFFHIIIFPASIQKWPVEGIIGKEVPLAKILPIISICTLIEKELLQSDDAVVIIVACLN